MRHLRAWLQRGCPAPLAPFQLDPPGRPRHGPPNGPGASASQAASPPRQSGAPEGGPRNRGARSLPSHSDLNPRKSARGAGARGRPPESAGSAATTRGPGRRPGRGPRGQRTWPGADVEKPGTLSKVLKQPIRTHTHQSLPMGHGAERGKKDGPGV